MKHLKINKFPFQNVIVLAIRCKMYLRMFTALVAFQDPMRSVVKKTRLNSSKDDFSMKSFPSSQKES